MNAFKILGIEPTEDKKTIKKAYAALVKKYHPEEDMQKWQEIHDAYQSALQWAEGRNGLTRAAAASKSITGDGVGEVFGQQTSRPVKEMDGLERADSKEQDEAELNDLFDNLEELSAASKTEKVEQEKQELQKALAVLDQMDRSRKLKYENWKELFFKEEYQQAMRQSAFLYKWSGLLEKRAINKKLYQLMDEQWKSIAQYQASSGQALEKVGLIDPVQLTGLRIGAAYDRYWEKRKKRKKFAILAFVVLFVAMPISIYKIYEWNKIEEWGRETRNEILSQMHSENLEMSEVSKKNLHTVADYEINRAGKDLEFLAEFLSYADDDILAKVLPHTQTLGQGVLALGEEFEIRSALYGKIERGDSPGAENTPGDPEKKDTPGNTYEMVPLTLPITKRIIAGKEIVTLPRGSIYFLVRSDGPAQKVLLWIDPEEMGFKNGCRIYCYNGETYQKAEKRLGSKKVSEVKYFNDVPPYRVFVVDVSGIGENEYPIVIIPES